MANETVRQFGTRDLLALISIVALHFAFAKFFVSIREYGLTIIALAFHFR
jgi:branched-subunit amino acid transport protein AzlD